MAAMFKGPQFYSEEESSIFKGREKEANDLLYLVEHSDFSVCYAVSGEGKSSLINAGLCPKLREDAFLPIHIKNITEAEVGHFDEFVWKKVKDAINSERKKDKYSELSMLKIEPKPENKALYDSVWWKLRTREFRINSYETVMPVLIFDQFEEVFSSANDLSWTDAFFCWLENLYKDENSLAPTYNGRLQKKFKVLLSLRSEYVCELDYWSMNKCFIPSLKNNRYYLKPLTKGAALEVVSMLDRLPGALKDDDIIKYAKSERAGEWENIKDNLPCVSALILSLILTGISEKNAEVKSKIEHIGNLSDNNKRKELFDFLLDNVYEKALHDCNATNNDVIRQYIETLEDTLIDVYGRRRHVPERELPPITNNTIKDALTVLEKKRIINVIDHHYEISHDSLCAVINNRKGKRHEEQNREKIKKAEEKAAQAKKEAEEAIHRKNQIEDLTSSFFLLIVFSFIIWFLSSVFQDNATFMNLLDLNGDNKVKYYNEIRLFYTILGNLVILPILIYSTVKKLKLTAWLSVYGIISNAILLYFFIYGQKEEMGLRTVLGLVTIGIPSITLLYSFLFHSIGILGKEDFKVLFNSIPLTIFFLAISIYYFYLCVFNDAIGLPEPSDSCWGIIVIPLLTYRLITLILKQKELSIPLYILIGVLGLLAYNTQGDRPSIHFYITIALIVCAFLISVWQYYKLAPRKWAFSSLLQSLVIFVTVTLNLGFIPIHIDYNSVSHVYNWKEIAINNKANHIGVVEACTGDTLLPCVFDSLKNKNEKFACLSTNKIQFNQETIDYNTRFRFQKKTGLALYQCLYIPSKEQYLYKIAHKEEIDTTLSDTISYYAARAFLDLRKANISFLQSGMMYPIDSVSILANLFEYQMKEMDRCLDYIKKKQGIIGEIDGKIVADFNKSLARTFYLCLLKDRITKRDSVNLFSLCQEIFPLYFYDSSSDFDYTINTTFNIGFVNFHKSYKTCIKFSNMRGDSISQIEAWYNCIDFFTLLDMSLNIPVQVRTIIKETKEIMKQIEEDAQKQDKQLSKLKEHTGKNNLSVEQLTEALFLSLERIKRIQETKQIVAKKLSVIEKERIQIDLDFQQLINKVFLVLPSVVTENPNPYNADFINICEFLYMVASVRLYDMSSVYLEELKLMDGAKMKTYNELKELQEEISNNFSNMFSE